MAIAMMSGIACWVWLTTSLGAAADQKDGPAAAASELAEVADQDVTAALATMNGSSAFLARFKDRTTGCPRPLAWVSVARAPGQPPGTVRLRSGTYFSPVFNLTDTPERVAIPYPGTYETGHGMLTALGAGGRAIIALRPVWRVAAQDGASTRPVTWSPAKRCKSSSG
ncbi:MAG TPA: hypothetical protein VIG49_06030 [Acetobacteraceae bacterium]